MSEAAGGFWSILGIFEKTYRPTYDLLGLYVTKPDFSIQIRWLHAVILG